uniref:Calcineurin-like phosphoesterase domain-containing protein n=2 Tax=Chrysotila carterae TaxID=13221 RepID=A0A7S4B6Q4_CHRCT|mmetsp:Transcript_26461/g.57991  ORF Transcript_26461/g.57991 Transcript_26461/m.57991 type:complete len:232 (+) Transcript_26461:514-1209(+)
MGDTGLRVKPKNNGFCQSPGSTKLYDIDQCDGLPPTSRSQFNESWVDGDFQALDDWPLESLSSLAAAEAPHAVVYVGDYLYRQGPCPYPNNAGADCTGINAPSFYELEGANLEYDFVPGNWGDNIYGWWADFFWPARDLLAAAPWIGIRGNHENCERAGHGWFLLISPHPLRKNWTIDTEGECDDFRHTCSPHCISILACALRHSRTKHRYMGFRFPDAAFATRPYVLLGS